MSDVMSNQKVAVGATNHSKLDVSGDHITTMNWMTAMPVWYRHMMPREHVRGEASIVCRLAPVAVPTYGRARINVRHFFVPFRCVFPNFNEFLVDTIASNVSNSGLVSSSPIVKNMTLIDFFITYTSQFGALTTIVTGNNPHDFTYVNSGVAKSYKFTTVGKKLYNTLLSLGYRIIWNDDKEDLIYSALPILCYAKIFIDWYSNSQYLDSYSFLAIERLLKYNDPTAQLALTSANLDVLLGYTHVVCYDGQNEVFTNAWDSPVAPNAGLFTPITGVDPTLSLSTPTASVDSYAANGTPYMKQTTSNSTNIGSQYLHDFLKIATDFQKRHQLAGARAVDRMLADFGVNLDSAKMNRSIFVSTETQDIEFGSVTSTAGTSDNSLGSYSGIGISKGGHGFDFLTDEFGMFISVASILPRAGYYQGFDRNNLHISKFDFFNPTYDNLSVQAINKGEVYVSQDGAFGNAGASLDAFGFAPRYYEYKVGRNTVSGDFAFPASWVGSDAWHLFRELADSMFANGYTDLVHSLNFSRGEDRVQYNRIFQSTDTDVDKFICFFHFAVQSLAPCKSLFDSYDFLDEAKTVIMHSNGTKVN